MQRTSCVIVVFLISLITTMAGTGRGALAGVQWSVQVLPVQESSGVDRKGMDILLSYDSMGNLTKVTVKSNQKDENQIPLLLNLESVVATLEDLVPEDKRGNKISQHRGTSYPRPYGRAYGEIVDYAKAKTSLTMVCGENTCGVSYAEMRLKP
ncbi:MAG: hypothetical protein ACRD9S_05495 [Pyrinomonadaceae bacterium]